MTPIVTTISLASHRMRNPRLTLTLAAPSVLVSLTIALALAAYIQARPNTPGVAPTGEFDANRAFADLKHLVSFRPRPPGSRALEQSREFIAGELHAAGAAVVLDAFTASTPLGPIPMSNIVAKIHSTSSLVVIIAGHYDTKRTNFPFVGANDSGSSAAFLLEMARILARRKNSLTYWLVFFDGEEALQRWSNTDGLYGSRHFAQDLSVQRTLNQVRALILVDMIADAHLDIHREAHSTPWLSDVVFGEAQRLSYGRYFLNSPRAIEDDHIPFLELGVPAVDIIDLDYGPFNLYWHTRYDTVDKCSSASLAIVARVVLATLTALETNLPSQPRGASS
jgi:Zn-dependent M28 family amino/carboxypeptidase